MNKLSMSFFVLICLAGFSLQAQSMNNQRLGEILAAEADSLAGQSGAWQLHYQAVMMMVLTDETHNRMRIISPIAYVKDLKEGMLVAALEANFHTALDVKYAISDSIIWSVFIHPLAELTDAQVKDAIKQVQQAAFTFGGSYTSTHLTFPGKE